MHLATVTGFLLFFLVALAVQAPAQLFRLIVPSAYRLAQTEGSLWQGSGVLTTGSAVLPLRWHWRPETMVRGALGWRIDLPGGFLTMSVSPSVLEFSTEGPTLDVALLVPLLPAIVPRSGWSGSMRVAVGNGRCTPVGKRCTGKLTLDWNDAQQSLLGPGRIGSYRLEVEATLPNDAVEWRINPLSGPLRLEGSGRIEQSGAIRFSGNAAIKEQDRARFEPFLRGLGRPGDDGPDHWLLRFPPV